MSTELMGQAPLLTRCRPEAARGRPHRQIVRQLVIRYRPAVSTAAATPSLKRVLPFHSRRSNEQHLETGQLGTCQSHASRRTANPAFESRMFPRSPTPSGVPHADEPSAGSSVEYSRINTFADHSDTLGCDPDGQCSRPQHLIDHGHMISAVSDEFFEYPVKAWPTCDHRSDTTLPRANRTNQN